MIYLVIFPIPGLLGYITDKRILQNVLFKQEKSGATKGKKCARKNILVHKIGRMLKFLRILFGLPELFMKQVIHHVVS